MVPLAATIVTSLMLVVRAHCEQGQKCDVVDGASASVNLFQHHLVLDVNAENPRKQQQPEYSEEELNVKERYSIDGVHNQAQEITNLTDKFGRRKDTAASIDKTRVVLQNISHLRNVRENLSETMNSTYATIVAVMAKRRDAIEHATIQLDRRIETLHGKLETADALIASLNISMGFGQALNGANGTHAAVDEAEQNLYGATVLSIGGDEATKQERLHLNAELDKLYQLADDLRSVQKELYGN